MLSLDDVSISNASEIFSGSVTSYAAKMSVFVAVNAYDLVSEPISTATSYTP